MLRNNYTQEEYRSYHVVLPADPETGNGELLLGDLNAATDQELMQKHNVRAIVTAATGLEHLQIPSNQTHVVFPLFDLKTQNIQSYFQLSNLTIEQNLKKGGVLVHCGAGISRSATLVIAYYMKKYQLPFAPAIKHVRKCRPNICPNLGFELQLKHYQQVLGLNQQKTVVKQAEQQSQQQGQKKHFLETKPMQLTFNAPSQPKPSRMSNTNGKNTGTYTPNPMRKMHNSSSKKTKAEGQFLVVGHQAEMSKEWGWGKQSRKGWIRGRDNHSFKL